MSQTSSFGTIAPWPIWVSASLSNDFALLCWSIQNLEIYWGDIAFKFFGIFLQPIRISLASVGDGTSVPEVWVAVPEDEAEEPESQEPEPEESQRA